MRRAGRLFERVYSFDNLWSAARRAEAGKRYRPDVLRFNLRREDALHELSRRLKAGTWRPGGFRHFRIHEPKPRWISAAPYRDRVVHHAVCNVIDPILDRRFVFDCWANRRRKGTHRAVLRYQAFAGRHRYALKIDLCKYFASIDHRILKRQFRRVFKDERLVGLMDVIVDHGEIPQPNREYFPGDDLFTPWERPKGLPIGNLTSQLWANLYLDEFDHWVKQRLRARAYLRFVDDFALLHDDKATLARWRDAIADRLADLRLRTHPSKSVIRRTSEGLPFLGYVVWPRRIRVRGATVRRFRRRVRIAREINRTTAARSAVSWRGHVELAGGWRRLPVVG